MNQHGMQQQVQAELEHIPRHPKQHQSELRMIYSMTRTHSLGKKAEQEKTKAEVLRESIAFVRQRHPDYEPKYDEVYFGEKGGK